MSEDRKTKVRPSHTAYMVRDYTTASGEADAAWSKIGVDAGRRTCSIRAARDERSSSSSSWKNGTLASSALSVGMDAGF